LKTLDIREWKRWPRVGCVVIAENMDVEWYLLVVESGVNCVVKPSIYRRTWNPRNNLDHP
jgi:hypothetical protein